MGRSWSERAVDIYKREGIVELIRIILDTLVYPLFTRPIAFFRHSYHKIRWGPACPEPYRLIHMDPETVEYVLTPYFRPLISRDGTYIKGGDWDLKRKRPEKMFDHPHDDFFEGDMTLVHIERYLLFHSIKRYIEKDIPWKETRYYSRRLKKKDRLNTSKEELEREGEEIERLYRKMKKRGYKKQKELKEESSPFLRPPEYDEVTVVIGRDGDIFLDTTGRHRFMIAKILEIQKIPARVLVRHEKWQKKRHEIVENKEEFRDRKEALLDHPDTADVVSLIRSTD